MQDYDYRFGSVEYRATNKVKISTPMWVEMYFELASYCFDYGSIDNRYDDNGNILEEYQEEFEMLTDVMEDIMSRFLIKED